MIEANVVHAAHTHGVQKLLFVGSSCIYPRLAQQAMREYTLLTGTLEATNEAYAIARCAEAGLDEGLASAYGDYCSRSTDA